VNRPTWLQVTVHAGTPFYRTIAWSQDPADGVWEASQFLHVGRARWIRVPAYDRRTINGVLHLMRSLAEVAQT